MSLVGPRHPDFWDHAKFLPQLKVRAKSGNIIPFTLWTHQLLFNQYMQKCYRLGKWLVHVKPRQEGSSTFFAGVVYQHVAYRPGCYGAILANKQKTATSLNAIARRFHRHCPTPIRTPSNPQVRAYLDFPAIDSKLTIASVQDDEPLRGDTCQILLATEVSSWPSDEAWASALNAVPDKHGIVIAESTPKHWGDQLHTLVQDANQVGSKWMLMFVPWTHITQYRRTVPPRWKPRKAVLDYANQFKLTMEQACWMQMDGLPKCGGSITKFRAEYPIDIGDCFVLAGEPIFDAAIILRWLQEIDGGTGLADDPREEVILKHRETGHEYVAVVDPAGSWAQRDFFALTVWDVTTCTLVYEWMGFSTAGQMAKRANDKSYYYSRDEHNRTPAMVVVEANGLGEAVLSHLLEGLDHPNVFHRESSNPLKPGVATLSPGFWSSSTTKAAAIAYAQEMIREQEVSIGSVRMLRQILQYRGQWDRLQGGRRRDDQGGHFDLAVTFFIFAWVYQRMARAGQIRHKRDPKQLAQENWARVQRTLLSPQDSTWNTPWGRHR